MPGEEPPICGRTKSHPAWNQPVSFPGMAQDRRLSSAASASSCAHPWFGRLTTSGSRAWEPKFQVPSNKSQGRRPNAKTPKAKPERLFPGPASVFKVTCPFCAFASSREPSSVWLRNRPRARFAQGAKTQSCSVKPQSASLLRDLCELLWKRPCDLRQKAIGLWNQPP